MQNHEVEFYGPVIEPDEATRLGESILGVYRDIRNNDSTFIWRPFTKLHVVATKTGETHRAHGHGVYLGETDSSIYHKLWEFATSLAQTAWEDEDPMITDTAYVGAAPQWHLDPQDYRVLINLAKGKRRLDVATKWEEHRYTQYESSNPPKPDTFKTITYRPGEAVILDNRYITVPHRGVKTLLRSQVGIRFASSKRRSNHPLAVRN